MTKLIQPKILKGTRDFLPAEMAKRRFVMSKMRAVFERFGYDTIETPVIEYSETLLGNYGDEGNKLIYRFKDNGARDIALRYDQTVPTARLVAANANNLPMPFKRYQISRVWRADKPAKGRYREFYQCDVDIIGTESLLADSEVTKVVYQVYKELGFKDFVIKINSRRLIDEILRAVAAPESAKLDVIRILDKREKISRPELEEELASLLGKEKAKNLFKSLDVKGSIRQKLEQLPFAAADELKEFFKFCKDFGIADENLDFQPNLARGLDYYTGIIYEVEIKGVKIGSVCGGGRYDDLCSRFSKKAFPGTGVAFGFDRTVLAMEELNMLSEVSLNSQVLVANFDKTLTEKVIEILNEIQEAGLRAEIYPELSRLARQFKYADKKQIPFVLVYGPDELKRNEVTVKIMSSGKQLSVPREQITSYLTGF